MPWSPCVGAAGRASRGLVDRRGLLTVDTVVLAKLSQDCVVASFQPTFELSSSRHQHRAAVGGAVAGAEPGIGAPTTTFEGLARPCPPF